MIPCFLLCPELFGFFHYFSISDYSSISDSTPAPDSSTISCTPGIETSRCPVWNKTWYSGLMQATLLVKPSLSQLLPCSLNEGTLWYFFSHTGSSSGSQSCSWLHSYSTFFHSLSGSCSCPCYCDSLSRFCSFSSSNSTSSISFRPLVHWQNKFVWYNRFHWHNGYH